MPANLPKLPLTVEHLYLTESEAARLLDGHCLKRGERVMDPKAQIVGEVIKQLRPPSTPCRHPRRRAASSGKWLSCSMSRRRFRSRFPI